jgi:hypothetical protein
VFEDIGVFRQLTFLLAFMLPTTAVGSVGPDFAGEATSWAETVVSVDKTDRYRPVHSDEENAISIRKTNPSWPAKGMITVEPCRYRFCVDV